MTVEELLQKLVDLVREGKGKKRVAATFFAEDGDYFVTYPREVEFNEHENEVEIKGYERKGDQE